MSKVGSTEADHVLTAMGFEFVDGHELQPLLPALNTLSQLQAFALHAYENENAAIPHYLEYVKVDVLAVHAVNSSACCTAAC
jgi:hypothetical protein